MQKSGTWKNNIFHVVILHESYTTFVPMFVWGIENVCFKDCNAQTSKFCQRIFISFVLPKRGALEPTQNPLTVLPKMLNPTSTQGFTVSTISEATNSFCRKTIHAEKLPSSCQSRAPIEAGTPNARLMGSPTFVRLTEVNDHIIQLLIFGSFPWWTITCGELGWGYWAYPKADSNPLEISGKSVSGCIFYRHIKESWSNAPPVILVIVHMKSHKTSIMVRGTRPLLHLTSILGWDVGDVDDFFVSLWGKWHVKSQKHGQNIIQQHFLHFYLILVIITISKQQNHGCYWSCNSMKMSQQFRFTILTQPIFTPFSHGPGCAPLVHVGSPWILSSVSQCFQPIPLGNGHRKGWHVRNSVLFEDVQLSQNGEVTMESPSTHREIPVVGRLSTKGGKLQSICESDFFINHFCSESGIGLEP